MVAKRLDFERALEDPSGMFGAPERVLADPQLDREGKRAILNAWARDARELDVAEEEGMAGGESGMLQRVLRALARISEQDADQPGIPTKHGSHRARPREARDEEPATLLVKDVMRESDEIIHVDHDLREALVRMRDLKLPFLPVVENDEVVGILTARDIYKDAQTAGNEKRGVKVRSYMSTDIAYCHDTDELDTARMVMDETGHHRLLVVDSEHQLVGAITLDSITAALREHGPRRPTAPGPETRQRQVKTPGRASEDRQGIPRSFAVRPKVKT